MNPKLGIGIKPAEYEVWCEVAPGDIRVLCTENSQEWAQRSLEAIANAIENGQLPIEMFASSPPQKELTVGDIEQFFTKKQLTS
jgi:hypothetical protein